MEALAKRLATAPRGGWPDRPVRVALVITELDVGGAERALVALATGLDRRRWEPSVIGLGPEGPLSEPLRKAGVQVECLGASPRQPWRALVGLVRSLRGFRPEVVQSFLFHANGAARLAAPWAGGPWVVGGIRVAEREKAWHRWLDRWTSRLAAGSVCVSEGVRKFSREVVGLPGDRLVVIPNGVDAATIDQAEPVARESIAVDEGSHLALFVGRLTRQKGVEVLLEAAAEVAAERGDWNLAIVGDGPGREELEARGSACANLAARIRWLGRRSDVPGLLKAADVLVLPSFWEGMPNVVLEAMAARRAVVGTDVEGTSELVVPGQTGWLVPAGDPRTLARALKEAAGDPDRVRRFGEAGRARVVENYSPERVVEAYERLWAGLLGFVYGERPTPTGAPGGVDGG